MNDLALTQAIEAELNRLGVITPKPEPKRQPAGWTKPTKEEPECPW